MTESYHESVEFLYGLTRHGIKLGLEATRQMLDRLGNPHQRYHVLHVGGTNGKGSCAAMAANILQHAGYRVGLYTSPHLMEFPERIRVQGRNIPHEQVVALTNYLRRVAGSSLALTFFEFTTCMAFHYFAEECVDVAVVEVGMGGRFDATNVVDPVGVLITNVAIDHEQYLGHTLPEIAFEKAGIIKAGVPVVLGAMPSEAEDVIRECASHRQSPCFRFELDFRLTEQLGNYFQYHGLVNEYTNLTCNLAGDHQRTNVASVLALLEVIASRGMPTSELAIRAGLSTVAWEGRLETLEEEPWVLLDGAHNPTAGEFLAKYLKQALHNKEVARLILIIGMMRDKNHRAFFERLVPLADHLILTQSSLSRASSVGDLQKSLPDIPIPVSLIPNPIQALEEARGLSTSRDLICITGSLILVGEVKGAFFGRDCASLRV